MGEELKVLFVAFYKPSLDLAVPEKIRAVRKRRANEPFSKQNHLDLDCLGLTKLFQVGFSGRSTPLPEDQMCSFQTAGESKHIRTKSKPMLDENLILL